MRTTSIAILAMFSDRGRTLLAKYSSTPYEAIPKRIRTGNNASAWLLRKLTGVA